MKLKKSKIKNSHSKSLACFFVQGGVQTAFTYLTSGVFLSGLAILMGAQDLLVSYLSVIINICGVLILGFSAFLERFRSRKRLAIALTALSRLMTLLIVLIQVLVPKRLQLIFFLLTVLAAFTLQAQTTVVLNQWMLGFMDERKSGQYISKRQTLALVVTVILSVIGGYWMDFMQGEYTAFVILFAVAAVMAIFELALLISTPDSGAYQSLIQGCRFQDVIKLPFKNRHFTQFVIYISVFYLLLNISDSFTMVYMMKYLALPYKNVTAMYMIISLPQIFLLGIWGKISDRKGHKFVLKTSVWFFVGETLFMSFSSVQSWYIFIPAAFLAASIGNAGFVIAVFNRRYELMPRENRIVYDNFYTAAIGIGFILGPMLGGVMKNWLENSAAADTIAFAGIRLLYPVSAIGIVILQCFNLNLERNRKQEPCGQCFGSENFPL